MEEKTKLVLEVESNQVKEGSKNLDKLTASSERTQKATDQLAKEFKEISRTGKDAAAAEKESDLKLSSLTQTTTKAEAATDKLAEEFQNVSKTGRQSAQAVSKNDDELKDLAEATAKTQRATSELDKEFKDVTQSSKQATASTGRLRDSKGRFVKVTKEATRATDHMGKELREETGELKKNASATDRAARSTNKLKNSKRGYTMAAAGATTATTGLAASLGTLLAPILTITAAVAAVVGGITKLVGVTREFDVLNAQLITATGSAEGAEVAFQAIQDFATQTPYALAQATESFSKLVNLGLTPSERALRSYGDTASAMGKDLNQLVEAVADAATGEFERLKEFGIKAKSEGDNVAFTFRGVTTTVKKNAAEIEEYLIALGENNFAGAMAERMNTLDGALSNLGDEWDKFWLNISQAGAGNVIETVVRAAISAFEELNAMLASGQIQAYLELFTMRFQGWFDTAQEVFDKISALFSDSSVDWAEVVGKAFKFILDFFLNLPENIRAGVRLVGNEVLFLQNYATAVATGLYDVFVASFKALVEIAKTQGKAIFIALNPFSDASALDTLKKGYADAYDTIISAGSQALSNLDEQVKKRGENVDTILAERDAILQAMQDQIEKAGELRTAYDEAQAARAADASDRLAGFKFDPGTDEGDPDSPTTLDTSSDSALESLRKQLMTEEEEIEASYQRRKAIILESTTITETERAELMARLENQHSQQVRQFELNRWDTALSAFGDFQNNLLTLAKSGNKKVAAVFKAAAIANAIIKTYESATSAYAALAPIPYVGPALGAAAAAAAIAAGLANVQAIKSQNVGSYATGGVVMGESFSGDNLTAKVNSGEVILDFPKQKRLLDIADGRQTGKGGSVVLNVTVNNLPGQTAEVTQNERGDFEITVKQIEQRIAQNLLTGQGPINRGVDAAMRRKGVLSA